MKSLPLLAADSPKAAASRPNILLIVSDDQGYADAGFHGCKDIPTPKLDQLAKFGVRCVSGYVIHPFCSPTRAALMTGRYRKRFGHNFNPIYDPLDLKEGLPLTEYMLPEFLKDAGYVTGWIGKWHLGASPDHSPPRRGFKETFGFIGGGHQYWNCKANQYQYSLSLERNGQPVEDGAVGETLDAVKQGMVWLLRTRIVVASGWGSAQLTMSHRGKASRAARKIAKARISMAIQVR